MAAGKLTAQTGYTTPLATDIIYVVADPGGTPASKKTVLSDLGQNMPPILVKGTTPSIETASGQTNTGFLGVKGKTSGELKITVADALAQTVTITVSAQTVGAEALTIPDFAGVADTFVFTTLAQTLSNKTFVAPVLGVATGTSLQVTGLLKSSSPSAGLGYATGAGGTGTQGTSKATTTTLSPSACICGTVTTHNASLNAATIVSFDVTNASVVATDLIVINHLSGGTLGSYTVNARAGAGKFTVDIRNNTAGSLGEALVLAFAVIKGVTA
jgi:hypothetical protein